MVGFVDIFVLWPANDLITKGTFFFSSSMHFQTSLVLSPHKLYAVRSNCKSFIFYFFPGLEMCITTKQCILNLVVFYQIFILQHAHVFEETSDIVLQILGVLLVFSCQNYQCPQKNIYIFLFPDCTFCIVNEPDVLESTILVVYIEGNDEVDCTSVNLEFPTLLNLWRSNLNSILIICVTFNTLNIDFYIIYIKVFHRELEVPLLRHMKL